MTRGVDQRSRTWSPATVGVVLLAGGGVMCLLAAALPVSQFAPERLLALVGLVDLAGAALLWLFRDRIHPVVFHVLLVATILVTSVFVSMTRTSVGTVLSALPYIWIILYAALFFPRRTTLFYAGFACACFGAGLLIGGMDHVATTWITVSITIVVAGLALSSVNAQLHRQALTDPLTGLLNRTGLAGAAEREIALADRTGLALTVAVLDLDDFKAVNDRDGHSAGDRVLSEIGHTWRTGLRKCDVLARNGGDEFVILLPATAADSAEQMLGRLTRLSAVEWSAGVVAWERGETFDQVLIRADRELYREKARRAEMRVEDPIQSFLPTSRAARSPERTAPSM
jgi:diguanylate cyclase (GGDEF)-like protein